MLDVDDLEELSDDEFDVAEPSLQGDILADDDRSVGAIAIEPRRRADDS